MILSVQKAMNILSYIAEGKNNPVTLKEISEVTGYSKPTCAHILETLAEDGYVIRVSRFGGYLLGPSLYCMTVYGRYGEELINICRPVIRWMGRKSNLRAVLAVIQSNRKYIIEYADGGSDTYKNHAEIAADYIYRSATGRAILAHMDTESVKALYEKNGVPQKEHWDAVTSYESLIFELDKLKDKKIIISGMDGTKYVQDHLGFACPIFKRKRCVGAIGLAWNTERRTKVLDAETKNKIFTILLKAKAEIERRLTYEGDGI